jgi:hypothetical protein
LPTRTTSFWENNRFRQIFVVRGKKSNGEDRQFHFPARALRSQTSIITFGERFMGRLGLAVIFGIAAIAAAVRCSTITTPPAQKPAFEVVSIKPSAPGGGP